MRTQLKMLLLAVIAVLSFGLGTGALAPTVSMVTGGTTDVVAIAVADVTETPGKDGPAPPPGAAVSKCGGELSSEFMTSAAKVYLPIKRWGEGTGSIHTRTQGGVNPEAFASKVQRTYGVGTAMTAGSGVWGGTAEFTEGAINWCVGDQIGYRIDKAAGSLLNALGQSGLVSILVVMAVISILWKRHRGENNGKDVARTAVALLVLGIMIGGAGATRQHQGGVAYGMGSPGWFGNMVNTGISEAATAPSNALATLLMDPEYMGNYTKNTEVSGVDCDKYLATMMAGYNAQFNDSDRGRSVVPRSIDSMWRSTGLSAYKQAQLGSSKWSDKTYCRLLEVKSGAPFHSYQYAAMSSPDGAQKDMLTKSGLAVVDGEGGSPISSESRISRLSSDKDIDIAMVAWAACKWDGSAWKAETEWADLKGGKGVVDEDCQKYFTKNDEGGKFNWGDNPDDISKYTKNATGGEGIADFMYNLHGKSMAGASAVAGWYAVTSLAVLAAFGLLSIAVMVAKIGLNFLLLLSVFVVILEILPSQSGSRIGAIAKQYVGMSLVAWGATFIISLVALMSALISQTIHFASDSPPMKMIGAGLAPVASIYMLHFIMTKVMKAPSPFKPSSGLAMGAALAGGGAVGGAVGATMGSRAMSRMMSSARHRGMRQADKLAGKMNPFGRGEGGRRRRKGAMAPEGSGPVDRTPLLGGPKGRTSDYALDESALAVDNELGLSNAARLDPGASKRDKRAEAKEEERLAAELAREERKEKRGEFLSKVNSHSSVARGGFAKAGRIATNPVGEVMSDATRAKNAAGRLRNRTVGTAMAFSAAPLSTVRSAWQNSEGRRDTVKSAIKYANKHKGTVAKGAAGAGALMLLGAGALPAGIAAAAIVGRKPVGQAISSARRVASPAQRTAKNLELLQRRRQDAIAVHRQGMRISGMQTQAEHLLRDAENGKTEKERNMAQAKFEDVRSRVDSSQINFEETQKAAIASAAKLTRAKKRLDEKRAAPAEAPVVTVGAPAGNARLGNSGYENRPIETPKEPEARRAVTDE